MNESPALMPPLGEIVVAVFSLLLVVAVIVRVVLVVRRVAQTRKNR